MYYKEKIYKEIRERYKSAISKLLYYENVLPTHILRGLNVIYNSFY